MTILGAFGFHLLLPLLFIVGMIVLVVRRGFHFKLLLKDGIETTGTVVRKLMFRSHTQTGVPRIRYEYVDRFGRTHSNRSTVSDEVYRTSEEGGPFPVVYSQSKPHISAPKYLVDQSRAALKKRSAGASSPR